MKVILRQDLDELGMEGDTLNVAKGYARNYLIPKGLALEANNQNIKLIEMQRKKIDARKIRAKESAEKVRQEIQALEITVFQRVGEEEKLYGSVTSMDIATKMEEKGVSIDRRKIVLDKPIKSLGEYKIPIKLHPEVTGSIKVVVAPEE